MQKVALNTIEFWNWTRNRASFLKAEGDNVTFFNLIANKQANTEIEIQVIWLKKMYEVL